MSAPTIDALSTHIQRLEKLLVESSDLEEGTIGVTENGAVHVTMAG